MNKIYEDICFCGHERKFHNIPIGYPGKDPIGFLCVGNNPFLQAMCQCDGFQYEKLVIDKIKEKVKYNNGRL